MVDDGIPNMDGLAAIRAAGAKLLAAERAAERERCMNIVTTLWGADLVTTLAAMAGEMTLDEAIKRKELETSITVK